MRLEERESAAGHGDMHSCDLGIFLHSRAPRAFLVKVIEVTVRDIVALGHADSVTQASQAKASRR